MLRAWSPARVRAAEETADGRPRRGELMARAAEGLAEVCRVRLTASGGSRVVVLAGAGNNGADALYAAAHLAGEGFELRCAAGANGPWPSATRPRGGGRCRGGRPPTATGRPLLAEADLVVDGVLGIGGRPGLPDEAGAWVDAIPDTAYVVSRRPAVGPGPGRGRRVRRRGLRRRDGHLRGRQAGPPAARDARRPSAGSRSSTSGSPSTGTPDVERLDFADVPALWPVPGAGDDKYSRGVLGVVAGGEDYTGAAVLCCTAAVGAGVGMLRYVGTPAPTDLVRAAVPEAVHGEGRVQAWVVGPGLDLASRARGSQGAARRGTLGARLGPAGARRRRWSRPRRRSARLLPRS